MNEKDLSYDKKISMIDDFIFKKAISNGKSDESRQLDIALVRQFKKLRSLKDEEKVDELYNYIKNNEDEAMNELNLAEKISNITGDTKDIEKFRSLFESQLEDEIETDNIFEDAKAEEKTDVLTENKRVQKEKKVKKEKRKFRDLLKEVFNREEKDDFLGIEIEDISLPVEAKLNNDVELNIVVPIITERGHIFKKNSKVTNEVVDINEDTLEYIENDDTAMDKLIEIEENTDIINSISLVETEEVIEQEVTENKTELEKLKTVRDRLGILKSKMSDDYSDMTVAELREIARENNIKNRSKMRKQELIDKLNELKSLKEQENVNELTLTR